MMKPSAKSYLIAASLLSLFLMIAFFDVVFLGKTCKVTTANSQALPNGVYGQERNKPRFIPVNGTDAPVMEEPVYAFIKKHLFEGRLPLWNPHQACGYPLIGMLEVGIFYPLNAILYLLPEMYAWDFLILLRILLGGFFVFWFMKSIGCKQTPSLIAGICFMLSGPMILLQYWTVNVDITAPLLLLAVEGLIKHPHKRRAAFFSGVVALSILGGHPEHIFLVNAYGFAFFIFRMTTAKDKTAWKKTTAYLAFGYMLGAGLAAVVLFPFIYNLLFEFWHAHPPRVGLLMEENRRRAITLLLPHFFQKEAVTFQWVFAGWWGGYIGILPFALAFLSLFNKQKRGLNYFFAAAAVIIICKQYGVPVINWLGYLPLFNLCRYAIHAPTLVALSVALAAGFGVRSVLAETKNFPRGMIFSAALILVIMAHLVVLKDADHFPVSLQASYFALGILTLFQTILFLRDKSFVSRKTIALMLVGLVFLELFLYIHRERPKRFASYAQVPYIEFLKSSPEKVRSYGNFWAFYPNTGSGFGVDDLGYFFGLVPKRFVHFINQIVLNDYFKNNLNPPALRAIPIRERDDILDLLNVKYLVTPADDRFARRFPHLQGAHEGLNLAYQGEVKIFERPNPFPRVFIVHRAVFQADRKNILNLVHRIGPQLRHVAVISGPPTPGMISYLKEAPVTDNSSARLIKHTPNEVIIETRMEHGGFLILSEAYHPDWTVTVNGKKQKVFQADYLLRAVFVPPGEHRVIFAFRPKSFYSGLVLSLCSLGIFLTLLRKRKTLRQPV